MKYPTLTAPSGSREMLDTFKGYNHNLRIADGEFYDMENMTSSHYPLLSPRGKRGVYASPAAPMGLIAKDGLCYVDGESLVVNGYPVDMGLTDEPKQLVSMGAYVVILPDKKYINTLDLTDFGSLDASFTTTADVTFELCTVDGEAYADATVADTEPGEPENMALWIDTSSTPHSLKKYSATSGMWVSIASTYIKISSPGIGTAFSQYDGVTISGVVGESLQDLNATMVLWACGDDYIVVTGILDAVTTQTVDEGTITVERKMPAVDFVTESGNRLWGCRYGVANNGDVVNEVYACKLGDFKNWNCFMGLATDSYSAACGTDGPFTGAITHLGFPLFFKEHFVHKVYGSYPANFQIQDTALRGVQQGCEKSMSIVNEVLYYKARHAVVAYDGSLPVDVSAAFGEERYSEAAAGAHGNKYYISMRDSKDAWHLFVYDTTKGMWHREDGLRADCFCSCRDELYAIDHNTRKIITMLGSGTQDKDKVKWMVQTGVIGTDMPDMKYVSRLVLRLSLEIGARVRLYAQYNSMGGWESLGTITGTDLRSFSIPVRPRRCDHLRLRIEGEGDAKVYSITKTISQGSDIS